MQTTDQTSLLERILASNRPVRLVTGPAASGKSTALRQWSRRVEASRGPGGCLIVVPTSATAARVRRKLLDESPRGVLVSPQVCTFSALAARILASAPEPPREISPFARQVLLRRILRRMLKEGRLVAMAASAETPGAATALDRAIAELKRAATDPQQLAAVMDGSDGSAADLLAVYRQYQAVLHETGQADVPGQMWLARDLLGSADQADAPGLEGVAACAVDGFTDFTPTQREILQLLAKKLEAVTIALPLADDSREAMWHWTSRTLEHLRRSFQGRLDHIRAPASSAAPAPARLAQRVFAHQVEGQSIEAEVRCIAAPGIDGEVRAVARSVKRLLLEGAPAGSIAVLARSIEPYRRRIETVFAEHDIPLAPAPRPLGECGAAAFCMQVANLWPDLLYRDVLAVLKSSYFQPERLGDYTAYHAAVAEMIIREGNVLSGREAYRNGARRIARRLAPDSTAGQEEQEDDGPRRIRLGALPAGAEALEAATAMLEALFDIAQQAGDDGPGYVIEALGLVDQAARCPDPALGAADLRALSAFERLLGQLGPDAADLAAVGQALSVATCPPARGESLVSVTDVLSARAMRWDHVFLLGCNEGGFPQPARDDALLSDARRSQWRGRLDLDTRSELSGREMLLFYLAISRCDKSLTVSYVEGEAGPASASHFLQALAEAFGPRQLPVERLTAGDLLPDSSELASRRDGRLAGICGLFQRRLDPDAAALAYARAHDPDYLRGAGEGIWVRAARWSAQPCGRFDGRLSRPELIEQLARRLGPDHVYSASQLNLFASCRWAFFARYVLGLEPLIEPRRQLEAADRGSFCHEVLYRLMTDLRRGYGEAFSLEAIDADRLISALDKAGKEASQPIEDAYPDYPMLWAIQRDDMLQQLRRYLLTQHAPSRLQPTHLRFELAFGIDDAQTLAQSDPDSTPDPVTVTLTGDQQIRLRGKIDRVDRAEFAGQVGLMVIDYKTGRLASRSDLDEGRDVQLALYIQAVRALLEEQALGGAYHQVLKDQQRCFGPMKRWGQEYRADEGFDDRCAEALAAVARYVQQMRSGDFSLYPLAQCESWCPYRWICQHSPAREQIKQSDDTDADREGRP